MLQKPLPVWGWAIGAVLVIAVILLGNRTMEVERQLKAAQPKIDSAIEGGIAAQSEAAELRSRLERSEREIQSLKETVARAEEKTSEYEKQIALLRQGKASCEEFFDGWEVKASPAHVVILFGIAREASAATDCINKGQPATACKHWAGLLIQIRKVGPPVSESRLEIERLMRQHRCKSF
jgi:regulator of replication initiation timing